MRHPLLIECDAEGRIVWLSERARQVVGTPRTLSDLILLTLPRNGNGRSFQVNPYQFSWAWEGNGRVLLSARTPEAPDSIQFEFCRLEGRLFRKALRLAEIERWLTDSAKRGRKTGSGRTAIRLIELERQRLGRELHTGVGQTLAAIRLQTEIVGAELPDATPKAKLALENIATLASGALEQVRSVSKRLHPPEWQRLSLESALQQMWQMSGVPERFQATLRIDPLPVQPDPEVKSVLYRGLQEILSNLVRHSQATRVDAALLVHAGRAMLTVTDNGVGFDPAKLWSAPASVGDGIGLRAMRDQTEAIGGDFGVESGSGGTKVVISVTLKE